MIILGLCVRYLTFHPVVAGRVFREPVYDVLDGSLMISVLRFKVMPGYLLAYDGVEFLPLQVVAD